VVQKVTPLFTARCTLVQSAVLRSQVVCLSVRPSVTLVDYEHIGLGWNSSEIMSRLRLVILGCSLSVDLNIRGLLQGEHPEILAQSDPPLVDLSVRDIRSQIAAEWLQIIIIGLFNIAAKGWIEQYAIRLTIAQWSQWRAYRKPPSLFRIVPSLTPTISPSSKNGGSICPKICEWPYFRNGNG